MKIGIVTLPLHVNYGGVLQAYALKTLLEGMGHEVVVLDRNDKIWFPKPWKAPFIYMKRALMRLLKGTSGPEIFREYRLKAEYPHVSSNVAGFTQRYISPRMISSYTDIRESDFDAFVVGSDQIWRPVYCKDVRDSYLSFAKNWNVKRVAYAASFGTEELEYDFQLLEECSDLLSRFDGVSVREVSGVRMCDEWLCCDSAVHVLDPVMMLSADHYSSLAADTLEAKGGVVTYILDRTRGKSEVADFVSRVTGQSINDVSIYPGDRTIPLRDRIVPPVEAWLASFMNADFVVTDSFHGCVLSILFHKPFLVVGNKARGLARIDSLLEMFGLESRLVDGIDPDDDGEGWLMDMDWTRVDEVLAEKRKVSLDFLAEHFKVDGTADTCQVEEE